MEQLRKFHTQEGRIFSKIPLLDKKPIRLLKLRDIVLNKGGHHTVSSSKQWAAVARELGIKNSRTCTSMSHACKQVYLKWIYPYEEWIKNNKKGAVLAESSQFESETKKIKRTLRTNRGERKPAPDSDIKDILIDKIRNDIRSSIGGKENSEKAFCELCFNTIENGDTDMVQCVECFEFYHKSCLSPPLESPVPENEWYCARCLISSSADYGFEDSDFRSLEGFKNAAHKFKDSYFKNIQLIPDNHILTDDEIEQEYLSIIENPYDELDVEYGADLHSTIHGSGFPTIETAPNEPVSKCGWNLNNIGILKGSLLSCVTKDISGMMSPWLYIGMLFSTFCWHTEDHNLFSINYNHFGAKKTWYSIPAYHSKKFEEVALEILSDIYRNNNKILFDITTMINPYVLKEYGIDVEAIEQDENEFIITFPQAYHAGFNHGFNFCEAVNFALPDWIPFGSLAVDKYFLFRKTPVFAHELLILESADHFRNYKDYMKDIYPELSKIYKRELSARDDILNRFPAIKDFDSSEYSIDRDDINCDECRKWCGFKNVYDPVSGHLSCSLHAPQMISFLTENAQNGEYKPEDRVICLIGGDLDNLIKIYNELQPEYDRKENKDNSEYVNLLLSTPSPLDIVKTDDLSTDKLALSSTVVAPVATNKVFVLKDTLSNAEVSSIASSLKLSIDNNKRKPRTSSDKKPEEIPPARKRRSRTNSVDVKAENGEESTTTRRRSSNKSSRSKNQYVDESNKRASSRIAAKEASFDDEIPVSYANPELSRASKRKATEMLVSFTKDELMDEEDYEYEEEEEEEEDYEQDASDYDDVKNITVKVSRKSVEKKSKFREKYSEFLKSSSDKVDLSEVKNFLIRYPDNEDEDLLGFYDLVHDVEKIMEIAKNSQISESFIIPFGAGDPLPGNKISLTYVKGVIHQCEQYKINIENIEQINDCIGKANKIVSNMNDLLKRHFSSTPEEQIQCINDIYGCPFYIPGSSRFLTSEAGAVWSENVHLNVDLAEHIHMPYSELKDICYLVKQQRNVTLDDRRVSDLKYLSSKWNTDAIKALSQKKNQLIIGRSLVERAMKVSCLDNLYENIRYQYDISLQVKNYLISLVDMFNDSATIADNYEFRCIFKLHNRTVFQPTLSGWFEELYQSVNNSSIEWQLFFKKFGSFYRSHIIDYYEIGRSPNHEQANIIFEVNEAINDSERLCWTLSNQITHILANSFKETSLCICKASKMFGKTLSCKKCKTIFHKNCIQHYCDTSVDDFCPLCNSYPIKPTGDIISMKEFKDRIQRFNPEILRCFFPSLIEIERNLDILFNKTIWDVISKERTIPKLRMLLSTLYGFPFYCQKSIEFIKDVIKDVSEKKLDINYPKLDFYHIDSIEKLPIKSACSICNVGLDAEKDDAILIPRYNGVLFFCKKCYMNLYLSEIAEEPSLDILRAKVFPLRRQDPLKVRISRKSTSAKTPNV